MFINASKNVLWCPKETAALLQNDPHQGMSGSTSRSTYPNPYKLYKLNRRRITQHLLCLPKLTWRRPLVGELGARLAGLLDCSLHTRPRSLLPFDVLQVRRITWTSKTNHVCKNAVFSVKIRYFRGSMESKSPVVGYWLSRKKSKKLGFEKFVRMCEAAGLCVVRLDLRRPLAAQGPFDVILHKSTDIIGQALIARDPDAVATLERLAEYARAHPDVQCLDPFTRVSYLIFRHVQYESLGACVGDCGCVHLPRSLQLVESVVPGAGRMAPEALAGEISRAGLRYPLVVKSLSAHGAPGAHQMAIVFGAARAGDIRPPCLVQEFVNHDGRLAKAFVVGEHFRLVERPSVRNLWASDERETVFFDSQHVSKADSASFLNDDAATIATAGASPTRDPVSVAPDAAAMRHILSHTRALGLQLYGLDLIRCAATGRLYVIDLNIFPSYDGMPEFFPRLLELLVRAAARRENNPLGDVGERRPEPDVAKGIAAGSVLPRGVSTDSRLDGGPPAGSRRDLSPSDHFMPTSSDAHSEQSVSRVDLEKLPAGANIGDIVPPKLCRLISWTSDPGDEAS